MIRTLTAFAFFVVLTMTTSTWANESRSDGVFQMDHVVILVNDLDAAMRDFETLGFKVEYGGEHDNGITHNGLIYFQDESFIELMSIKTPAMRSFIKTLRAVGALHLLWPSTFYHRFTPRLANREGYIELGFLGEPLQNVVDALRARGLDLSDQKTLSRRRPDGKKLTWNVSTPSDESVPFLRSFASPTIAPQAEQLAHPNGAVGVARITVPVANFEKAVADYERFFGERAKLTQDTGLGVRVAEFTIRGTIVAVADATGNEMLARYIDSGGERPFEVRLNSNGTAEEKPLDLRLSHGARLMWALVK